MNISKQTKVAAKYPVFRNISGALRFLGVTYNNSGHSFWESNSGDLDVIFYDAKKKYLYKIRKVHPDYGGTHDYAVSVNRAWSIIKKRINSRLMKKLLIIGLLMVIQLPLSSATFILGWDERPLTEGVIGYVLYNGPMNALVRVGTVGSTNQVQLTLPDGAYRLSLTSTNFISESDPSAPFYVVVSGTNVVTVTSKPGSPLNLQIR